MHLFFCYILYFKLVKQVNLSSWLMMIFGFGSLQRIYNRISRYNNIMHYNITNYICIQTERGFFHGGVNENYWPDQACNKNSIHILLIF